MNEFYNTNIEEQETILNIDHFTKELHVYTCRKSVYRRLEKKLGQPQKTYYIKGQITGGKWVVPFNEKKAITSILSRPLLIGQVK